MPALSEALTPTVATGIPLGICTIDSSESSPSINDDLIGSAITGKVVYAAITPPRCAAFPAAAMITLTPLLFADFANSSA